MNPLVLTDIVILVILVGAAVVSALQVRDNRTRRRKYNEEKERMEKWDEEHGK